MYERWFLTPGERGNPDTGLDRRHPDGTAWTTGDRVRALVHGRAYFAELLARLAGLESGDVALFTDWRGDPDQLLAGPDTEISGELRRAAERGVLVKGLIWRSHLDKLQFSEQENRHLGEEIEAAGGECLLDMRVRSGGSHHQKLVVLRHRRSPERDVAYVGGIDLCHGRRDDSEHCGDPQATPISAPYGDRPPWHDLQLAIEGPAVGEVEAVFRERWEDPNPLSRNPVRRLGDAMYHDDTRPDPLPPQFPDPPDTGTQAVQLLRTYPYRRRGYPFARQGERTVARGYAKALTRARELIYVEDQYLWSAQVAKPFADALAANPELRMIVIVPRYPDTNGRIRGAAFAVGRIEALDVLHRAGSGRFAVYSLENHAGAPVYVHAKAVVVDDLWATVGSDNLNLRSWTHDSELSCAVMDPAAWADGEGPGRNGFPAGLRSELAREHLDRLPGDDVDLRTAAGTFAAFEDSAGRLDAWYDGGRKGPRPPGRLRRYHPPELSRWLRLCGGLFYRTIADPDGRPRALRRRHAF